VRHYRLGAHTKSDLKVHLIWVPKYRKPVLTGDVAIRVRDLLRQIAMEHELEIVSGKVARDHVHLFVSYRPNQQVSQIMQWLKGISSRVLLQEFPQLRKKFWGRHFWARGYLAVSSGTITDEMIREYIEEQAAAKLVDVLVGESPTRGTCPVAPVVISGGGAGDQSVGSPEVKVLVG
jgi:putative transposase